MDYTEELTEKERELFNRQIAREREDLQHGMKEQLKKNRQSRGKCYFSHTKKGIAFKKENLTRLSDALKADHAKQTAGTRRTQKDRMINTILDVVTLLKPIKMTDPAYKAEQLDNIFDLMAHITLTAFLDDSMAPPFKCENSHGEPKNDFFRLKKTTDELERSIGEEILFQLKLYLISLVAERFTKGVSKFASNKGLANKRYHHYNVNRLVDDFLSNAPLELASLEVSPPAVTDAEKKAAERIRQNAKIAKALNLMTEEPSAHNPNAGLPDDCEKFLGDWCKSVLMDPSVGINAFEKIDMVITKPVGDTFTNKKKKEFKKHMAKTYIPIAAFRDDWKDKELERLSLKIGNPDEDVVDKKLYMMAKVRPMLTVPKKITDNEIGGWQHDYKKPLASLKGNVDLSNEHLDFYNRQAAVPFKINHFIYELLKVLKKDGTTDQPIKLGSFKHHTRDQNAIPKVWDYINKLDAYKRPDHFDKMSREDQKEDAIKQVGEQEWIKAKQIVKDAEFEQVYLIRQGIASAHTYAAAGSVKDDERFYLPIRYDFRGRVIMRVPYINYQAADHGKALVKFAEGKPIDARTRRWLLIELANNFGAKLDKQDFATRVNVMLGKLDEIEAVARMVDEDHSWQAGFDVLKQVDAQDGKVFQFAAACREFYEIYIAKTKTTTDLVVKVDCTTSSQQIASVWLKDKVLALQTNVVANPDGKPMDLYYAVFQRMLDLLKLEDDKDFTKDALTKMTEMGFGRAIVKSAFQGAAYGAGRKTQHEAINEKLDKLESEGKLKLLEKTPAGFSERSLFLDLFDVALQDVCKLNILNNWFQELAEVADAEGLDEIVIPTPIKTKLFIHYKPRQSRRVWTFGYGSTQAQTRQSVPAKDPLSMKQRKQRLGNWRTSNAPNVTHSQDACLIALALHDWEECFTSCHDSLGTYAGSAMDEMRERLRQAFTKIASYDIFGEILKANNLMGKHSLPPINNWSNMAADILAGDLDNHYFTS